MLLLQKCLQAPMECMKRGMVVIFIVSAFKNTLAHARSGRSVASRVSILRSSLRQKKESCIVVFVGWQIIIQDTIRMIRYWDILFMYVVAVVLVYTNIIQLFFCRLLNQFHSFLNLNQVKVHSLKLDLHVIA